MIHRLLSAGLVLAGVLVLPGGAAEDKKDEGGGATRTAEDTGWVQLFNGKNLDGWFTLKGDKAKWEVKDGILIGTGDAGHLYSKRGDYRNFHYRIEAKINDKGNSGQYFRTTPKVGFPPGYEAQINSTHPDPVKTGSLYGKAPIYKKLVKPDEWFTQEVIARGNHIIIKVNGQKTVDFVDDNNTYKKGHFALQQHNQGSEIRVRKIEVKELPPE